MNYVGLFEMRLEAGAQSRTTLEESEWALLRNSPMARMTLVDHRILYLSSSCSIALRSVPWSGFPILNGPELPNIRGAGPAATQLGAAGPRISVDPAQLRSEVL